MAKPAILTHLKKGMVIDTQTGFVDTFNYLVDFIEHLKGDYEENRTGAITIDKTFPDFPVIRLKSGSGSGGSGSGGSGGAFAYDPSTMFIRQGAVSIGNEYVTVSEYGTAGEGSWRVEVNMKEKWAVIMQGNGFESPPEGSEYSYIPLYDLSGGKVVNDWRGSNFKQTSKPVGSFSYDESTHMISDGAIAYGRAFSPVTGAGPFTDGNIRLRITYGSHISSFTTVIEQGNGFEDPTETESYVPLYVLANGKVVKDYRYGAVLVVRGD